MNDDKDIVWAGDSKASTTGDSNASTTGDNSTSTTKESKEETKEATMQAAYRKLMEEAKTEQIANNFKKTFIPVPGSSTEEPNSHGVALPRVGTGIKVENSKIDAKIAAAAVN